MEPDVIRMYSSSPPPMEDGAEEEDDEFGDFGTFSGVPSSVSFSELDTPTSFDQNQALTATSPPDLHNGSGVLGFFHAPFGEPNKANGRLEVRPSEQTDARKTASSSQDVSVDCNGEDAEVLTNGFVTFDLQGSPSSQDSVSSHARGPSTEGGDGVPVQDDGVQKDEFADFAAFSDSEETQSQRDRKGPPGTSVCPQDRKGPLGASVQPRDLDSPVETSVCPQNGERGAEDAVRDVHRAEAPPGSCNMDRSPDCPLGDACLSVCTMGRLSPNGTEDEDESREAGDERSSETSLGRLLSTDGLEDLGDISTTGSSPPPPGDAATPAGDDFGDFGDATSFGAQGFSDFEQNRPDGPEPPEPAGSESEDDFGDFNSPKVLGGQRDGDGDGGTFADFPSSESFGNFSSVKDGEDDSGWSAFSEQNQNQNQNQEDGESWAAFSSEPSGKEDRDEEREDAGRTVALPGALSGRLEKLFLSSFPVSSAHSQQQVGEGQLVETLKVLLEPRGEEEEEEERLSSRSARGGVWTQLQDVHEALGLRYQWGGSHGNKVLLCCLGIDTRNILFTGQKKQPVIVPMYAAGLGMLEPTKEPLKPISAAEMIASIALMPPAVAEKSSVQPDSVQEALPPVQFDWSSSGLTNPLDASGGSALLNLDFFGPVEDSGSSSSASIPGVDPELFELTTAKLDPSGAGSRVADAFARLMSTMEKTSTSTRKPRREENLSDEASKVIAALPDLSFMQAKVLMFPATLTPLCSHATPD
ncbi:aftiphilin a isoform X2 [Xiphophorus hellerii]|uniref:aftiphilin a isoform X2 n=1 Tax=Xiphophorus hellerii TaxID=8084 RepID=UPI0013B42531|nr:aftiphilin-like isoform X2 [Xiphophorus hellerii]